MTAPTLKAEENADENAADHPDRGAEGSAARRWELGRVFVLRHAGMPFDWLEELAAPPELLQAAAAVLAAEAGLLAPADHPGAAVPERLRTDVRMLRVDAVPATGGPGEGGPWIRRRQVWVAAVEAYRAAFEAADREAGEALREVLSRDPVPEAVFLSNPEVYRNMLVPFLAQSQPLNARWRRARRQLYTYVQRLCAKNETVSFFGPMAYGRTVPDADLPAEGVRLRTDVPPARRVFIAHWAAGEVATAIARDRRLRAVLPFRRTGAPLPAPAREWLDEGAWDAVLGTAGASLTAIATAMGVPLREAAVRVQPLVGCGYLEFGPAVPPYELEPLSLIAAELRALGDAVATGWADRVSELAERVRAVERSPFPARIDAVDALERAFTELTGRPARRGSGAVYADRAVFYEECSSPFALEVSERLAARWAERIGAALELSVAHGDRTQRRAAQRVRAELGDGARLTLPEYGERLGAAFDPGRSQFGARHAPDHPAASAPDVVAQLLAEAATLGDDRYALVDLCPATGDVSGLDTADLVLSRCHHHLLTSGWLGTMFPGAGAAAPVGDRDGFGADAALWVARRPDLVGLDVGRRNKGYYRFPGRRLVLRSPNGADRTDRSLLWPAELTVRTGALGEGEVWCTDPDGERVSLYLPLSDYVKYPPYAALSYPQVVHASFADPVRSPEITVGDVVYQRPRQRLAGPELTAPHPAVRFLQLRRVADTLPPGADRFVFCRTESERKPYLIDLASVLAADLVAHVARGGSPVLAEQMRPAPGELWLRDGDGRRYTAELRIQALGRAVR